jgi:hypothetical protein
MSSYSNVIFIDSKVPDIVTIQNSINTSTQEFTIENNTDFLMKRKINI